MCRTILCFLIFAYIPLFLWTPLKASAQQPRSYTFSSDFSLGFLYGQAEEIVYKSGGSYLSQLLWDMKPLFYWGLSMHFGTARPLSESGFLVDLALKYGFESGSGVMEDRDWQAADGHLTNYSRHDNYTQNALLLDLAVGYSLPVASTAVVKLYGFLSFMDFSWKARDGYKQYTFLPYTEAWTDSIPKSPHWGPAVDYHQLWYIGGIGAGFELPFADYFALSASFNISPLVFCATFDSHPARKLHFDDYLFGGIFVEPKAALSFSPVSTGALTLSTSYRFMKGAQGQSYLWRTESGPDVSWLNGNAGAGFAVFDTSLSIRVNY